MKIDHTGFCLSEFDTDLCRDCPTLRDCLVMYAKDAVKKVLDEMNISKKSASPARQADRGGFLKALAREFGSVDNSNN